MPCHQFGNLKVNLTWVMQNDNDPRLTSNFTSKWLKNWRFFSGLVWIYCVALPWPLTGCLCWKTCSVTKSHNSVLFSLQSNWSLYETDRMVTTKTRKTSRAYSPSARYTLEHILLDSCFKSFACLQLSISLCAQLLVKHYFKWTVPLVSPCLLLHLLISLELLWQTVL